MTLNLHVPTHQDTLKPKITVVGVGGAGGNAVNNMIASNLEGVGFVMANTDAQALESAMTDRTIQLGAHVTRGLGAGANPDIGRGAAEEALEEIADHIEGSHMVFITAGMGGGTGTGAAPVIAQLARDQGILTVGVVTKPFQFEGAHRMKIAERGIEELEEYVDTLIVIPNQNLFRIANEKTTFADAFRLADEVLHSGVRGVTDLMVKPGLVNLDFADIRSVMSEMGKAMMGTGEASSERRAIDAAESAISNPLLDDVSLKGAKAVLINITGGPDMTLFEVDEAANRIRDEVDPDANIIFGSTFSDSLEGLMRVSVVATGIRNSQENRQPRPPKPMKETAPISGFVAPKIQHRRDRSAGEIVRDSAKSAESSASRSVSHYRDSHREEDISLRREESPAAELPRSGIRSPSMLAAQRSTSMERDEKTFEREEDHVQAKAEPKAKQEEVATPREEAVGDLFVSPRAERPTSTVKRESFKAAKAEPEADEYDAYEEEEESSYGFFQRIAGVGKALAAKPQTETIREREEEPRAKVSDKPSPVEVDEDQEYLDIPAFLRRQAN